VRVGWLGRCKGAALQRPLGCCRRCVAAAPVRYCSTWAAAALHPYRRGWGVAVVVDWGWGLIMLRRCLLLQLYLFLAVGMSAAGHCYCWPLLLPMLTGWGGAGNTGRA
jgi:hypothetical protein